MTRFTRSLRGGIAAAGLLLAAAVSSAQAPPLEHFFHNAQFSAAWLLLYWRGGL